MRYVGQGWEIPVDIKISQLNSLNCNLLKESFEQEYENIYGRKISGLDIETTIWSVNAISSSKLKSKNNNKRKLITKTLKNPNFSKFYDQTINKWIKSKKIDISELQLKTKGPSLIHDKDTTIVLPTNSVANLVNNDILEIVFNKKKIK